MVDTLNQMVMTNGVHTVPVIRSAFDEVWSKRGWEEAPEGAEETPRVLGLGPEDTIEEYLTKRDAIAAAPDPSVAAGLNLPADQAAAAALETAKAAASGVQLASRGGVTATGDSTQSKPADS